MQESDFLRSLNDTLLANQRDLKQQLAAEKARTEAAEAAAKDLQEQVGAAAVCPSVHRLWGDAILLDVLTSTAIDHWTTSDVYGGGPACGSVLSRTEQARTAGCNWACVGHEDANVCSAAPAQACRPPSSCRLTRFSGVHAWRLAPLASLPQVRDLAFFIEAQKTISDAAGGELKEGTLLPLPQVGRAGGGGHRGLSVITRHLLPHYAWVKVDTQRIRRAY